MLSNNFRMLQSLPERTIELICGAILTALGKWNNLYLRFSYSGHL